eukprot:COSAG04_NODE_175_length_21521_cov_167.404071_8_plen_127_part_00
MGTSGWCDKAGFIGVNSDVDLGDAAGVGHPPRPRPASHMHPTPHPRRATRAGVRRAEHPAGPDAGLLLDLGARHVVVLLLLLLRGLGWEVEPAVAAPTLHAVVVPARNHNEVSHVYKAAEMTHANP